MAVWFDLRLLVGTARVCGLAGWLLAGSMVQAASLPSVGTVTLEFGSTDQIRYEPAAGAGFVVPIFDLRKLTGSPKDACALAVGSDPAAADVRLLRFAPSGRNSLGFNSQKDWIGIREQKRGVDCGRVVAEQGISLSLGDHVDLAGLKVVDTVLELNVKKSVVIDVSMQTEGEPAGFVQIRSGFAVVPGEGQPPAGASGWVVAPGTENIFNCNPSADSGPDSDASCRIEGLAGIWDTLQLSTTPGNTGEWSLGAGTSVFHLGRVDGILDCQETTIVAEDPDSDGSVQLRRLDNIDGSACVAIPYTLSFGNQTVTFLADYLGQDESVAFEWMVTWAPEALVRPDGPDDPSALESIPVSMQQFRDVDPAFALDLCVGTPQYGLDGLLTGVDEPTSGFPDMSPDQEEDGILQVEGLPGVQYGCLLERDIDYLGELEGNSAYEQVRLRESGYLQGDWISSRNF